MSTVVKDLGAATAYGYAVEKGYTGTEAEFAELMASYATVGQTAVTAAQTATTKASEAATSATTATNKATEATTAATTATNKAAEAQADADAAALDASQAMSAASTATTKATEATTAAATATSAATTATTAKDDAVSAKTAAQTAQAGAETAAASVSASAAQIQTNADDISELKEDLTTLAQKDDMLKAFPTDTASGSVASFADGANVPVKSLIVNIDPVQSGSGDPSPTNVRPISGWSEVNVSHSGADMTNPTVITIQLGQTVYGGTLDVTNGVLTIDRAMIDIGTLNWTKAATQTGKWRFGVDVSNISRNNSGSTVPDILCEVYAAISPNDTYTGVTGISNNVSSSSLFICDLSISEVADLTDVINGKKVVYPLATPLTITLDPHEVTALLGSNNVWADSGDSEVTYRADPTLYIGRLTEPDADMVADSNITSGSYFMVGNTLYKATANIASGGAITPNVNCVRKSLSEALNELNA